MSTTTTPIDLSSEEFADLALDEMEETTRTPHLFTLKGQEFTAAVLGFGSSYSESLKHRDHIPGTRPTPGVRCPACRWADIAILYATSLDKPMYMVALMGKSVVPGESNRVQTVWTEDPLDVLESIKVTGPDGNPRVPGPNARAFRYAAFADEAIRSVLYAHEDEIPNVYGRSIDQGF